MKSWLNQAGRPMARLILQQETLDGYWKLRQFHGGRCEWAFALFDIFFLH